MGPVLLISDVIMISIYNQPIVSRYSGLLHSLMLVVLTSVGDVCRAEIPPKPNAGQFLHDYANVLNPADRQRITKLQERLIKERQLPLVVVTIHRMNDYDAGAPSIENFAKRWFDAWGIGTQNKNDGILLIVSTGDRKSRIELGVNWGRRFDGYAQQVTDVEMIPKFKAGNYSGGILAATESLSAMAISGPQAEPPKMSMAEQIREQPVAQIAFQNNPIKKRFGGGVLLLMFLAGIACLVASIFLPKHRKPLIITGLILVALAIIFWIVIIVVALIFKSRNGGIGGGYSGGGYSGGGYSGGGFGGGSSGGGGASGSW